MIGVFDSGHGGLTILRALAGRFPARKFVYLGDHANVPYGNRASEEIVEFTRAAVETLFRRGCRLVVLGCNTATCIAARALQREWLPQSGWAHRNVLGIVAPTVEAATQTAWACKTPQYPQKYNSDLIAVFGTTRTIASQVFPEEIRKRCPRVQVAEQACAELAGAIEAKAPEKVLDELVQLGVDGLMRRTGHQPPHRAILGCTHFPLVEHLFRRHLPPFTRILSQPEVVADSLEDYMARHPEYLEERSQCDGPRLRLLTTGEPAAVDGLAQLFWPGAPHFIGLNTEASGAAAS
jgi:glutamate racemase